MFSMSLPSIVIILPPIPVQHLCGSHRSLGKSRSSLGGRHSVSNPVLSLPETREKAKAGSVGCRFVGSDSAMWNFLRIGGDSPMTPKIALQSLDSRHCD
jgi:hypothetical protein